MLTITKFDPRHIIIGHSMITIALSEGDMEIDKDGELFVYNTQYAKKILLDRKTMNILNGDEVLIFHLDNRCIKPTLKILANLTNLELKIRKFFIDIGREEEDVEPLPDVIQYLEEENFYRLMDKALEQHDYESFKRLLGMEDL